MSVVATMTDVDLDRRAAVLEALRRLEGRATVADVAASTGMVRHDAEDTLRSLLATHRGHVEVGEAGDLVWAFEPKLLTRDHIPWSTRVRRSLGRFLRGAFKVWITLTLLVYFVVFVALAIAAIVVVIARGGGDRDIDFRGGRHFRLDWLWFLFWAPDWRWGRPYYGDRYGRLHGPKARVPFYKKVFAFVFGPDEPVPTQEEQDRELLALVRARRGVITATELMLQTGDLPDRAHEELGRLMGAYEGDARATTDGEVVYVFPELMVSAHGRVTAEAPPPAWRRLLPKRSLTGNTKGTNAAIVGINLFNLVGAVAAGTVLMPTLGLGGPVAWTALVWLPLAFSGVFFGIPAFRRWRLRRENERRLAANVRRILLGRIAEASLDGREVSRGELEAALAQALPTDPPDPAMFEKVLRRLIADFDADVRIDAEGTEHFAFPAVRRAVEAGAGERATARLEEARVGTIVYSSADDPTEAARRELETFDNDYRRSLQPGRVAWADPAEDVQGSGASPSAAPPERVRRSASRWPP